MRWGIWTNKNTAQLKAQKQTLLFVESGNIPASEYQVINKTKHKYICTPSYLNLTHTHKHSWEIQVHSIRGVAAKESVLKSTLSFKEHA